MTQTVEALVIRSTLRVPLEAGPPGDGRAAARQLDAALLSAGFKLSRELLENLSARPAEAVRAAAAPVLAAARQLAGGHVEHNVYFRDFPAKVPDTMEFWVGCIRAACPDLTAELPDGVLAAAQVNLLTLPSYVGYQHSFAEMVAAHDELIPGMRDRVTVLQAGGPLAEEASHLYLALAGRQAPLPAELLAELPGLARYCASGPQPGQVPVRENRAVINAVRLELGGPLAADTVTDVLRLACALSGGDVTLETPTRFGPFPRPQRRALLALLDEVISGNPAKLADTGRYAEQWKRLGERLHPHEYLQWPLAQDVFAVARGDQGARSIASLAGGKLASGDVRGAADLLRHAPGLLMRSVDWLLRTARDAPQRDHLLDTVALSVGQVPGRVLLSVREHLQNRVIRTDASRVFVNRAGGAWVTRDGRVPLDDGAISALVGLLDAEVQRRLPDYGHIVIDPAVLGVALPLSAKGITPGLGVLPRGSVSRVDGELLRFFAYWKQHRRVTDYDLSALMLDDQYGQPEQVPWTNYGTSYATYSGDLTEAPDGAAEFIDIELAKLTRRFVIPQLNIFAGESFGEADEAFFGFMTRDREQAGQPFEPRTVRMKSDLRGGGRVALPLVFMRGDDGHWRAKWLHLSFSGYPNFNRVEGNRVTTALLVRGIVERDYLRVSYLLDQARAAGATVTLLPEGLPDLPVTFVGLEMPDGLAPGSVAYTPANLAELIPA